MFLKVLEIKFFEKSFSLKSFWNIWKMIKLLSFQQIKWELVTYLKVFKFNYLGTKPLRRYGYSIVGTPAVL